MTTIQHPPVPIATDCDTKLLIMISMQWKIPFRSGRYVPDYDERGVRISKIAGIAGGVLVREVTLFRRCSSY